MPEPTVDNYLLRLIGTAYLEGPLNLDCEYTANLTGEITKITDTANDDGTVDRTYTFRLKLVNDLIGGGQVYKAKAKSRRSVALRHALWYEYQTKNLSEDFDDWYERVMNAIIHRLPEVLEFISGEL